MGDILDQIAMFVTRACAHDAKHFEDRANPMIDGSIALIAAFAGGGLNAMEVDASLVRVVIGDEILIVTKEDRASGKRGKINPLPRRFGLVWGRVGIATGIEHNLEGLKIPARQARPGCSIRPTVAARRRVVRPASSRTGCGTTSSGKRRV